MTDETADLGLKSLPAMREDVARLKDDVSAIRDRWDGIDLQLGGWRYVFVATTGSLVADMKGHETRIAHLEGTRV